ncbi:uncharacterized protein EV420DRAFT_1635945 [Desarmillaria tabescens]|uniref:Uncharacterized protein n=1 Tax=Armillaria tabescens TaxID=1929756 RepID=A0AA39NJS0_ARMTA|nr:uncharacterized protein EV420DRAFT_1635945 [Desarmillaria tabescens]KAK0466911.1 hypothetical protein EV420DRAFT_1635945 [Desarmillaria tabescens]
MITNNQFIQTTCYMFAVAIATALLVTGFVKDILTFLEFWTWSTKDTISPDHLRIAVMVKVEVTTTHYSTTEPLRSVSSDCALVNISSKCYSGTQGVQRTESLFEDKADYTRSERRVGAFVRDTTRPYVPLDVFSSHTIDWTSPLVVETGL